MTGPGAFPTIGRYELVAPIAAGGMGSVVLGRLAAAGGFQRLFALKFLHREYTREQAFLAMFLDEARIAARIHHPNVVSIQEVGETAEHGYFLVMDFVDGFPLADLIPKLRDLPPNDRWRIIARIFIDALNGLDAAHTLADDDGRPMEVVHRDVSPQNILVGADGITRVTDFGIARAKSRLVNTGHGEVKGKFGYMSPEQVRTQPVDARSDLFAMGVVLWEAIAQKRLFYGSPVDVVAAVAAHRIRDIREEVPSTPPALVAVLDKALQREPATRYQTARAFADAIDVALRGDNHVGDAHDVGSFVRQSFARQLAERRAAVKRMAHDTIVSSGPKPFELPDALAIPAPRVVSPMAYEATQPGAKVTPSHHADADAHQITERSEARTSSSPSNTDRVTSERITVPMIRPRVPQSVTTPPTPAPAPSIPPIAARISHPPGTEIDDDDFYGRAATSTMDANDAPPEVRALLDGYHALMAQPRPVASAASAGIAPARAVPPSPAPASTASAHASAPLSQPSLPPPPAYPSYPSYPSAPIVPSPSRARTWIAVLVFAFVSAAAISWVFVARK